MKRWVWLIVLTGCASSHDAQLKELATQACFGAADVNAIARAREQCHGYTWDECPFREDLVKHHRRDLEACRQ